MLHDIITRYKTYKERCYRMNPLPITEILKTKINITSMQEVVEYMDSHLNELRGSYICISNVHTTVTAYRDESYRKVQNGSVLNLPDGKPLSIVQKKKGFAGAQRVPGPDLMPEVFALSEERGYKHFFYGSTQKTLDELEKKLRHRYPKLQIAGMYSPPFRPLTEEEDHEVTDLINAAGADFIWIGLGAPKQERWMAAHEHSFNGVMLGVGAGFDFHAGTIKRAPKWMQEFCMEWLYRIMQDPKRLLVRYLDTNFSFLWYLWKEKKWSSRRENKKFLKIAMVGQKRIPSREGGVEVVVDELSTRFVKLGHKVDAYNRSGYHVSGKEFDESRGKIYEGIRLITIPTFKNSSLNAMVYSILASFRLLFGRYDIVHYHAEGPCTMLWLPKLFGFHVVATIHGLDWQRSKWGGFAAGVLKFGEKMAARHADDVIVLSRNVQDYFCKTYDRETLFIPNGIARPEYYPVKEIKEKYGLEKEAYILFLARIVPEKGLHYLIDAFSKVHTDKKLVIAGGISHSKDYMDMIRTMAAKDDRVIMTDFVQGRILAELCSNAYVFVLPSDVEGMAVSLLEAMSYGNCCLVSDIEENLEVVQDCAVSFEKANIEDLKEKLENLIRNPDQVEMLKKRSADFICNRYNWDDVVKQTLEVYRKTKRRKSDKR